jgi:hypothetical protein
MWKYVLAALLVVVAVAPLGAGVRVRKKVVTRPLGIDGVAYGSRCAVSSPTVECSLGYLSYDASGKSPEVSFDSTKGPHTTWAFVELRPFGQMTSLDNPEEKGHERWGYTMKLRAAEGPLAGWYLGRVDGKLVLVKDYRQAATVRLESEADVDLVHR